MKLLSTIWFLTLILTQTALAYEKLESGSQEISVMVGDKKTKLGDLEYRILSVRAIGIMKCDNHPDDPICEFDRNYYERSAYPYVQAQRKRGFREAFYSVKPIDRVKWEDISEADMVEGILVLFKGPSIPGVTDKVVEGLAKKHCAECK